MSRGRPRRALHIALVGCLDPPQADFDALPLAEALAACGHRATEAAWDDPDVDWSAFDAAVLRSAWNYYLCRDEFLAWVERSACVTRLVNRPDIVRWNTHKFYLRDLAARGIDIAPTLFLAAGTRFDLAAGLAAHGWDAAVLKPAVSADSFATVRATRATPEAGQRHLDAHLGGRDMLVQRYLPSVVEPGERCLVFLGGRYSHAVRKRSLFLGGRHTGPEGTPVEAAPAEIETGRRILACLGNRPPLYARIDLLGDARGVPCLMELELVEPSLFLATRPGSAADFVRLLLAELAQAAR